MKYTKLFSFLTTTVIIAAVIFSWTKFHNVNQATPISHVTSGYDSLTQALQNMRERSIQSPGDTISKIEYSYQLTELQQQLNHIKNQSPEESVLLTQEEFTTQTFWIKVIFSGIFCIAALYVVLSKKYDEETKKWAFSVLTLIAGVWIGTIS